jgi:membrane fusion protein (multidrug efflux system)
MTGTRKKTIGRIAIGVAVVALAYGVYALIDYRANGQYIQSTDDAYVQADGVAVSSKLAGYVRQIGVADNQQVGQGAFLVQIDPTDYATKLTQADAQVTVAARCRAGHRGRHCRGAGQPRPGAGRLVSARAISYYAQEVARYAPLAASGAEPRTQLDQLTSARQGCRRCPRPSGRDRGRHRQDRHDQGPGRAGRPRSPRPTPPGWPRNDMGFTA